MSEVYTLEWEGFGRAVKTGHFIFPTKPERFHGEKFLDIKGLCMDPIAAMNVCRELIQKNAIFDVGVVLSAEKREDRLAFCGAHALSSMTGRGVVTSCPTTGRILLNGDRHMNRALLIAGSLSRRDSLGPLKQATDRFRSHGTEIVGVIAILNREFITAEEIGVPRICSLVDVLPPRWSGADCPMCDVIRKKRAAKRAAATSEAA